MKWEWPSSYRTKLELELRARVVDLERQLLEERQRSARLVDRLLVKHNLAPVSQEAEATLDEFTHLFDEIDEKGNPVIEEPEVGDTAGTER